jgi:hypothetical protein
MGAGQIYGNHAASHGQMLKEKGNWFLGSKQKEAVIALENDDRLYKVKNRA